MVDIRKQEADLALERGDAMRTKGDFLGAEAAYREADEAGSLEAVLRLADLYAETGDERQKLATLASAANTGYSLMDRGDLAEAEALLRGADDLGGVDAAANLGVLLERRGDLREAEAAYRRAADRGGPDGKAHLSRMVKQGTAADDESGETGSEPVHRRTLSTQTPPMRGDDVRLVQQWLGELGYRTVVDGNYGPAMADAVAEFQRAAGIDPDGVVGPQTWRELALSPSVRRAVQSLTGAVTASALAAKVFDLHGEYAAGAAGSLRIDVNTGPSATPQEWVDRARAVINEEIVLRIHGRLLVAALARGDEQLAAQLRRGGTLRALEGEIQEPLASVFRSASPTEPFDFVASATSDIPAEEDVLGFRPLVTALYTLLDDKRTVLPLAIAVTAPWGAGKSSVMHQLKAALKHPPAGSTPYRRWSTVQFDAWKYERSERLWAAMAKAIYDQPQRQMSPWGKLTFRVRLERERLGAWKLVTMTLWPLVAASVAVTTALASDLTPGGTLAALVTSGAAIAAGAARYSTLALDPFRRAIDRHAARPDYETQLGFTAEADRDIQTLTRVLARRDTDGLAVFVDDLDRCSSAHVVEVVEAMNQIFNAAQGRRCVFVLGLDRDIVASNIEVAYSATVQRLEEAGNPLADHFGREFLSKLVQLSVAIPQPAPEAIRALLAQVTDNTAPPPPPAEREVEQARTELQRTGGETLAEVAEAAGELDAENPHAEAVAVEAVRRERAKLLRDSQEVVDAEFAALEYLDPNPRQVKRFHNAFRLQLYVANEDPRVRFDFTRDELAALARWVALRMRWPEFGDDIVRWPDLLPLLETSPEEMTTDDLTPEQARYSRWFQNEALRAALRDDIPARRVSSLPLRSFLRVA